MLSEELHRLFNEQINNEMWSAYLYLSMSMEAENKGLPGIANWFYVQYREELDHARIMMNYVNSRDAKVELKAIDAVPTSWKSVGDMFKTTYQHEQEVTAMINQLAMQAKKDHDFASENRLIWFIDEQVEEEENVRNMLSAIEAVEDNKYGLFMLDKELGGRTYTTPSPLTK